MPSWQDLSTRSDGQLRLAAIGHGVDLSAYPSMQCAALDAIGISAQVVPLDVERPEFESAIRHLQSIGFRGATIANPHKVDAARISERFWVVQHGLGVANSLLFDKGIFAQNTEVPGIMKLLKPHEPAQALVMGTGHAARSVVLALLETGWKVKIWNRNLNKTRTMVTLFMRQGKVELAPNPDPTGCRLIVNATPLGVKLGEKTPLQWTYAQPKCICFDLVYRRVPTEFLREATNRGFKAIDGRELMVEQSALALEWWVGREVPRDPMRLAVGLRPVTA